MHEQRKSSFGRFCKGTDMKRISAILFLGVLFFILTADFNIARASDTALSPDRKIYLAGQNYMIGGRYDDAAEQFEKLKRLYPLSRYASEAILLAGECYQLAGDGDKAKKIYLRWLSENPESEIRNELLYRLIGIYKNEGNYERMLLLSRIVILSNPIDSEWTNKLSCAPLWELEVDKLADIAIDREENLYILQTGSPVVTKYSITGEFLGEIELQGLDLRYPFHSLALDNRNNIYIYPRETL